MTNNQFASALKSPTPEASKPARAAPAPAGERGKRKHIGGYFDPALAKRLRVLASEEETTAQQLLAEALELLFRSRNV